MMILVLQILTLWSDNRMLIKLDNVMTNIYISHYALSQIILCITLKDFES